MVDSWFPPPMNEVGLIVKLILFILFCAIAVYLIWRYGESTVLDIQMSKEKEERFFYANI